MNDFEKMPAPEHDPQREEDDSTATAPEDGENETSTFQSNNVEDVSFDVQMEKPESEETFVEEEVPERLSDYVRQMLEQKERAEQEQSQEQQESRWRERFQIWKQEVGSKATDLFKNIEQRVDEKARKGIQGAAGLLQKVIKGIGQQQYIRLTQANPTRDTISVDQDLQKLQHLAEVVSDATPDDGTNQEFDNQVTIMNESITAYQEQVDLDRNAMVESEGATYADVAGEAQEIHDTQQEIESQGEPLSETPSEAQASEQAEDAGEHAWYQPYSMKEGFQKIWGDVRAAFQKEATPIDVEQTMQSNFGAAKERMKRALTIALKVGAAAPRSAWVVMRGIENYLDRVNFTEANEKGIVSTESEELREDLEAAETVVEAGAYSDDPEVVQSAEKLHPVIDELRTILEQFKQERDRLLQENEELRNTIAGEQHEESLDHEPGTGFEQALEEEQAAEGADVAAESSEAPESGIELTEEDKKDLYISEEVQHRGETYYKLNERGGPDAQTPEAKQERSEARFQFSLKEKIAQFMQYLSEKQKIADQAEQQAIQNVLDVVSKIVGKIRRKDYVKAAEQDPEVRTVTPEENTKNAIEMFEAAVQGMAEGPEKDKYLKGLQDMKDGFAALEMRVKEDEQVEDDASGEESEAPANTENINLSENDVELLQSIFQREEQDVQEAPEEAGNAFQDTWNRFRRTVPGRLLRFGAKILTSPIAFVRVNMQGMSHHLSPDSGYTFLQKGIFDPHKKQIANAEGSNRLMKIIGNMDDQQMSHVGVLLERLFTNAVRQEKEKSQNIKNKILTGSKSGQ